MADYSNSAIPRNDDVAIMTNDIRQTLGLPISTINNRFGRLCVHENINMFALKKPVSLPDNAPNRANEDWCKGDGQNYGIKIPAPTTIDALVNASWIYERPTGGAKSPYRLYDFVGYRHKCPKPYYKVPKEIYTNKDLQNNKVTACYPMSESGTVGFDKYKIQLSAASSGNQNFYAAILVKDASNDGGYVKTHHSVISGGEDKIEFDLHGLPAKYQQGLLQVCCFITNKLQVDWISSTKLPLGFLVWGGYGVINYTTYVSKFLYPAELSTSLDREYTFIDTAEPINIIVRNIRTDGKSIDIRNGVDTSRAQIHYEVTSASGETFTVNNFACTVSSGSALITAGNSCTLRFDRMLGYTENGQQVFPPDGFSGYSHATIYYTRTNDTGAGEKFILGNFSIRLISSGIGL